MRNLYPYCFLLLAALPSGRSEAQRDSATKRHQIAVFIPLYLDSAFDQAGNYRYDKSFPKFINPGLEFYEGLQLAVDSLQKERANLDIQIYDTRASGFNLRSVVDSPDFHQTGLIIGHVNPSELRELAAVAAHLSIPFIDVNYPNDGGITNNPDFVILNSTLKSHCEGIYKFIQRNYSLYPIYLLRKKGAQEDRLQGYFQEIEKNTASVPLKLKILTLDEPLDPRQLIARLDSTRKTICVVSSLDENFGKSICAQLSAVNKTYVTKIIGMPTWDDLDFTSADYSDQEIYYTTPFYTNPNDSLVSYVQQYFKTKFFSRPSDMVFRGFETVYRFAKLLQDFGLNLDANIGSKKYKLFTDFDIQPVFLSKQNMTLDYFENKKLYFIKKVNGNTVAVY
jgi:hypothetical protein